MCCMVDKYAIIHGFKLILMQKEDDICIIPVLCIFL